MTEVPCRGSRDVSWELSGFGGDGFLGVQDQVV